MSDKLTDRLRGRYKVGPGGVYGTRDFSGFIPPICEEAAARIETLEHLLKEALPHIECTTHEQSNIITAIGDALDPDA
jgi:hypothetical protein